MSRYPSLTAGALLAACAAAPLSNPYSQEAQELIRTCRYEEARPLLDARLAATGGDERIATLLQLGTLEENAGNLPKALAHYRAAHAETQSRTRLRDSANLMLGMASTRQRDYATAIATLSESLRDRDSQRRTGALLGWDKHAALGVALAETGRFAEASDQFARAIKVIRHARNQPIQTALASWKQAADDMAQQRRTSSPGYFWNTAYGDADLLASRNQNYRLVPLHRVAPLYPPDAKRNGITGFVDMEVSIDEQGKPVDTKVVASYPVGVFNHAAVVAVSQWRFQPRIKDCQPVPASGMQRIEFRLGSDPNSEIRWPEAGTRVPLPRERD